MNKSGTVGGPLTLGAWGKLPPPPPLSAALLSTTGLTMPYLVPSDRHSEEQDQLAMYRLFSCSAQLAAHGVTEGEACMDVLVTSADKPRP